MDNHLKTVLCTAINTETNNKLLIYKDEHGVFYAKPILIDKSFVNNISIQYEGVIYRHFKGGIYKAYGIAKMEHTNEKFMIYQNISPDQPDKYLKIYARPLKMFKSLVDKKKYPDIKQKYRFEKIKEEK